MLDLKNLEFKEMRILFLPFIIIIYPFICGFTFEEDVLAKCGAKHPNDFIGRFVCNRNIVKQNKLDLCLEKNIKYHQIHQEE